MNIVITGSSKGIGLGMAKEFITRGHNVVVSSRRADAVETAVQNLNALGGGKATGLAADVSQIDELRALWAHAQAQLGGVDIWVNNAGMTNQKKPFHELPDDEIPNVISTNLTGMMNGCKVAITNMLEQGHGKIFNMEGFGSDGMIQPGLAIYGSTKIALRYFTKALVKEYADSNLHICYLSPGIVVTDLLSESLRDNGTEEFKKRKKFLNILADKVETVTPALVDGILEANKNGAAVRWMTTPQAMGRMAKSLFVKREILD